MTAPLDDASGLIFWADGPEIRNLMTYAFGIDWTTVDAFREAGGNPALINRNLVAPLPSFEVYMTCDAVRENMQDQGIDAEWEYERMRYAFGLLSPTKPVVEPDDDEPRPEPRRMKYRVC